MHYLLIVHIIHILLIKNNKTILRIGATNLKIYLIARRCNTLLAIIRQILNDISCNFTHLLLRTDLITYEILKI